ncbi:hypothetical protein [Mesorhizobium sp.]|uniref:hypothetical protein n=1 Tax=Mesorhizobium sp. TaxID=1871066 RepID=UPI00257B5B5B|nr:hypothetical protein [Mesorhizobium sp.]
MTDPAAGWLRGTTSAAAGWMPTSAVNNSEKLTGPRIAVLKRPLFERLYDGSFIELSNTPLQQIAEYGKRCCPNTQHRKTGEKGMAERLLAFTSVQAWGADRIFDDLFQKRST